jgi:hypothetical protein
MTRSGSRFAAFAVLHNRTHRRTAAAFISIARASSVEIPQLLAINGILRRFTKLRDGIVQPVMRHRYPATRPRRREPLRFDRLERLVC